MTLKPVTVDVWRIGKFEQLFRKTKFFNWSLASTPASRLSHLVPDYWRGSASLGSHILTNSTRWRNDSRGFDQFEWLRDLRAFGGSQARSRARQLIESWIDNNHNWRADSWQPDIMGQRVANLIFCYDWYAPSAPEDFQTKLTRAIALQARCLALDWSRLYDQTAQLTALKGLFVGQSALGAKPEDLAALLARVLSLVDKVTQADGGHNSRMPDIHLKLMRDLVEIRNAASSSGVETAAQLDKKIAQMASICRMWRHADGRFARFNGAGRMTIETIEETLARVGQRGKVLQKAPYSGFVRISSGRSTVIMDSGSPQTSAAITGYGTLAFEFAVGQNLLVINPGQTATDPNLHRLLCSTKAHSTLSIDGQDSSKPAENRLAKVSNVEIGPAEGGLLAVATHDGYEPSHGILHNRHLFLAAGGGNLRGNDTLEYTGAPSEIPRLAVVRFHLHPRVTAAMLHNKRVLLKVSGNRAGWVFRSNAATTLDNSLFFDGQNRMNCQQIVVNLVLADLRTLGSKTIKWAFTRSDAD
jgi:uncharacterized heparinase superfamily protein